MLRKQGKPRALTEKSKDEDKPGLEVPEGLTRWLHFLLVSPPFL